MKTVPKGFSASKCDVGDWIFSKSQEFFDKLLGIFWIFRGIFLEFLKNFGLFLEVFFLRNFFGGIFWEEFFERIFWEDFFGRSFVRNSLFTLELTCLSRFWFLSRFCLKGEEEEGKNLDPQKCDAILSQMLIDGKLGPFFIFFMKAP